ncbi:MAG: putative DNA binding domain-containing protein [Acidimicrobiaceae bacterium]|nr:putative DNA binding domain-containing protein [Acidimicrobiaceae bacterium]MDE0319766.1 putative DNA binding domain-containing protein [Acidimicrobiaceae bacterium]MDE0497988.1 putative DNA binding domain-containing protein [Acidimicrobiaceae bacterium]
MTPEEIEHLAEQGESETIEFKATTGQRHEAAKTLSAMLNSRGGQVIFGVSPKRKVTGQQVGEDTLTDITEACQEIHPRHPPSIERIPLPNCAGREVVVATVPPGTSKPYAHRGRHYIRSGAATVAMPEETQLSLVLERAHVLSRWESESSRCDFDAIDESEVHRFRNDAINAKRAKFDADAPVIDVLRALNLLDSDGMPNRGAMALFGRADALGGTFPTLGCRLVAVDGTELAEEFRDDLLVNANVFASLRHAMDFCDEHLHRRVRIGNELQAATDSEIPGAVVREALANAFCHRDYAVAGLVQVHIFSDRLEVHSPGQLHFGLTPADLYVPHTSHPWNPDMLGCLYRRGIVEQLGSGTVRMVRLCAEAGLGRPLFAATSASVSCSVPRQGHWLTPSGAGLLPNRLEAAVLTALAAGPAARRKLTDDLEVSISEVREALRHLRDLGLIRVEGHGRGARWELDNH